VIRAEVRQDGAVLDADLAAGSFAYIDADWLTASARAVPSIVVSHDGSLAWCGTYPLGASRGTDPETAAALVLLAVAREAASAVEGADAVEVTGNGLIARRLRALLAPVVTREGGRSAGSCRPAAVVETTGDPAAILDATRRVADLGIVVLVGESLDRRADLNLYPDVHVRGLSVLGVAPPNGHSEAPGAEPTDPAVRWCRELLVRVHSGEVLPAGAAWYAVGSRR
jgi:hypothetical protein